MKKTVYPDTYIKSSSQDLLEEKLHLAEALDEAMDAYLLFFQRNGGKKPKYYKTLEDLSRKIYWDIKDMRSYVE